MASPPSWAWMTYRCIMGMWVYWIERSGCGIVQNYEKIFQFKCSYLNSCLILPYFCCLPGFVFQETEVENYNLLSNPDSSVWPEIFFVCLAVFIFIAQANLKKEGEIQRKLFHPLIHSPNICDGWNWTDRKPAARSQEFLLCLLCRCRVPRVWAIILHFPRP